MPRPRPPYPAQEGLFGEPTLINNVETYANIAPIIRNGGAWYAKIGTEKSKGTKVFALAGRSEQHGPRRSANGDFTPRDCLRHRWRHTGGQAIQGSTDRRSVRRMPARRISRHAGRLREPGQGGLDHGIRRNDRDGRKFLHGGCCEVLHGFLHERVVRKMCAVPGRYLPHEPHSRSHHAV